MVFPPSDRGANPLYGLPISSVGKGVETVFDAISLPSRNPSRAHTISRPSRDPTATINAPKLFAPSASADATSSMRLVAGDRGFGHRIGQHALAWRQGQVEPCFRPDPFAVQGRPRAMCETRFDDQIAIRLKPRRQGPIHLRVIKYVDIRVDDEHMFRVGKRPHNHPAMAFRASPGMRCRSDTRTLKLPPDDVVMLTPTGSRTAVCKARQIVTSARMAFQLRCIGPADMLARYRRYLKRASLRRVIAVQWKTGVAFDNAVITEKFAVWTLRFGMSPFIQITLDYVFCIGRNADVVRRVSSTTGSVVPTKPGDRSSSSIGNRITAAM